MTTKCVWPPGVAVPVICKLYVPDGVPGGPLQPAKSKQASAAAPKPRRSERRRVIARPAIVANAKRISVPFPPNCPVGVPWAALDGMDEATVMVPMEEAASEPSRVTEFGARTHVVPTGAPKHDMPTVCVDSSMGVTVTVNVVVLPSLTVAGVVAVIVKSRYPLPVSGTTCGLLGSPSENVSVALAAPIVTGVKFTLTVQFALGCKVIVAVGVPQLDAI